MYLNKCSQCFLSLQTSVSIFKMLRKLLSASVVSISQHLHVTPNVIPLAAIRYNSSLVQQFQQANLKTIFKTHVQDPVSQFKYTLFLSYSSEILK